MGGNPRLRRGQRVPENAPMCCFLVLKCRGPGGAELTPRGWVVATDDLHSLLASSACVSNDSSGTRRQRARQTRHPSDCSAEATRRGAVRAPAGGHLASTEVSAATTGPGSSTRTTGPRSGTNWPTSSTRPRRNGNGSPNSWRTLSATRRRPTRRSRCRAARQHSPIDRRRGQDGGRGRSGARRAHRLFSGFVLHPRRNPRYDGRGRAELVDAGTDLMIELQVREQALVGYTEERHVPSASPGAAAPQQPTRRLAHPVRQRAVVAAARAERRHPQWHVLIRSDLRGRPRVDRHRLPPTAAASSPSHVRTRATPRTVTPTRVGANPPPGKLASAPLTLTPLRARPVPPPAAPKPDTRQRQMSRVRQPVRQHRRLEQAGIQLRIRCPADTAARSAAR